MARSASKPIRPIAGRDADEVEAVAIAATVLQSLARVDHAEAVTTAVISTWILERMKRTISKRLCDNVVFDLEEAKLKGMVSAVLPQIANALEAADFPFGKTFSDLSRDEALTLFLVGCIGYREAAIAAGEAPDFPFSDPIPFGDVAA